MHQHHHHLLAFFFQTRIHHDQLKLCYGNSPELGGERKKSSFLFSKSWLLGEPLTTEKIILALGKEAKKRKKKNEETLQKRFAKNL